MAQNAIPAPIMYALAEATDKAFEWADNVAESGEQHPGRLAIAAEFADHLRGFGYEIQPITGEIPAPVCTDCGGPGGYHAAQCYEIERPRAATSCSCGCPELPRTRCRCSDEHVAGAQARTVGSMTGPCSRG